MAAVDLTVEEIETLQQALDLLQENPPLPANWQVNLEYQYSGEPDPAVFAARKIREIEQQARVVKEKAVLLQAKLIKAKDRAAAEDLARDL